MPTQAPLPPLTQQQDWVSNLHVYDKFRGHVSEVGVDGSFAVVEIKSTDGDRYQLRCDRPAPPLEKAHAGGKIALTYLGRRDRAHEFLYVLRGFAGLVHFSVDDVQTDSDHDNT